MKVISRRSLLTLPLAAACTRRQNLVSSYAFVANQEGGAIAAVDLDALAVTRHIPVKGSPMQVLAGNKRPSVYALTPETGTVHEIQTANLRLTRTLTVSSSAASMLLSGDEQSLLILSGDPKSVLAVDLETFKVSWRLPLPEMPVDFTLAYDGKNAGLTLANSVRLLDLTTRQVSRPLGEGDFGALRFLSNGETLIAANRAERLVSVYHVASQRLMTHLPVVLRPDQMCFDHSGGQLFVTGEGMDAVVVIYPYYTPRIGMTLLAGRGPAAMDTSSELLFVASPQSGDVSIINIEAYKLIGVAQVGNDPGFIKVTPDERYALVLNRSSGDIAVLSVRTITKNANRYKTAALLTVIPVGSRPVSAAVRGV